MAASRPLERPSLLTMKVVSSLMPWFFSIAVLTEWNGSSSLTCSGTAVLRGCSRTQGMQLGIQRAHLDIQLDLIVVIVVNSEPMAQQQLRVGAAADGQLNWRGAVDRCVGHDFKIVVFVEIE